jgi:ribosomal protein L7/L12
MERGERVRAMKYYQEASGASLKDAVDFIDEAERHHKSAAAG